MSGFFSGCCRGSDYKGILAQRYQEKFKSAGYDFVTSIMNVLGS
jgi:hypothetical protein